MKIDLQDFHGMKNIDVVGLLYGYKKIISTGLETGQGKRLEKVFSDYGLVYKVMDEGYDYRRRNSTYIISKRSACLRSAAAAYRDNRFDLVGRLLGYPACCVSHHWKKINGTATADDFGRRCNANSSEYFWPINNLLDFDGRLFGKKAAGLDLSGVAHTSLISHNPCSYDCGHSLKIAKLNYHNLKDNISHPGAESDYSILAKPALYADDFNLAILNGTSGRGSIAYSGAAYILGFAGLGAAIKAGDTITVSGKSFSVLRKGKTVLRRSTAKKPLILPFDRCAVPGF